MALQTSYDSYEWFVHGLADLIWHLRMTCSWPCRPHMTLTNDLFMALQTSYDTYEWLVHGLADLIWHLRMTCSWPCRPHMTLTNDLFIALQTSYDSYEWLVHSLADLMTLTNDLFMALRTSSDMNDLSATYEWLVHGLADLVWPVGVDLLEELVECGLSLRFLLLLFLRDLSHQLVPVVSMHSWGRVLRWMAAITRGRRSSRCIQRCYVLKTGAKIWWELWWLNQ